MLSATALGYANKPAPLLKVRNILALFPVGAASRCLCTLSHFSPKCSSVGTYRIQQTFNILTALQVSWENTQNTFLVPVCASQVIIAAPLKVIMCSFIILYHTYIFYLSIYF